MSIRVPKNHVLMVSVPKIKMYFSTVCVPGVEALSLTVNGKRVWMTCSNIHPLAAVYTARTFSVEFTTSGVLLSRLALATFKLFFSFHNGSAIPQQLPDGTWNCSVPHWSDFRHHLHCNLMRECAGGEDEVDCGFHSKACGTGRLAVAGKCYSYIQPGQSLPWNKASDLCQGEGGQLVSLNTPEEWLAISDLLSKTNFGGIFLGLSSRNPVQLST